MSNPYERYLRLCANFETTINSIKFLVLASNISSMFDDTNEITKRKLNQICDINKNSQSSASKTNEIKVNLHEGSITVNNLENTKGNCNLLKNDSNTVDEPPTKKQRLTSKPHVSPKKRLNLPASEPSGTKYIYGNYSRYYGYRNLHDFKDVRLEVFLIHKDLFEEKDILDIGCNSGVLTMEIAKGFNVKHIIGMDIDRSLISKAVKHIQRIKKSARGTANEHYPFNIHFIHGNYVLIDDVLLEIEQEQFNVILCLSVTKWIHLNFGDKGLKQAFKRMFLQLRPGGKLILEAQPWSSYKRRKKLTKEIFENYKSIKFLPEHFTNYLLGPEVGFSEVQHLGIPGHSVEGFKRPIQVFVKREFGNVTDLQNTE